MLLGFVGSFDLGDIKGLSAFVRNCLGGRQGLLLSISCAIGALIITYTILGVSCSSYSITGPKTLS